MTDCEKHSGPMRRQTANCLARIQRFPADLLVGCVCLYQLLLSPIFGRQCRFYPTCSDYFIQAVRKYGVFRGAWRGVGRILRCHPWHPGGVDPP